MMKLKFSLIYRLFSSRNRGGSCKRGTNEEHYPFYCDDADGGDDDKGDDDDGGGSCGDDDDDGG